MESVGIIGYGFVGQAVHSILTKDVNIYDKYKPQYSTYTPSDIEFVCLPTLTDGEQDTSAFDDFFSLLSKFDKKPLLVIKSTILFNNLMKYNYTNMIYSPEFLNANTSFIDSKDQKTVILGGEYNLCKKIKELYLTHSILDSEYTFCSIKEAIDFKYTRNIYGAYKVLFWEYVEDVTGNSRKMKELYDLMPQSDMAQVSMDGYRGYGGACFPKDVQAKLNETDHTLLKYMEEFNSVLKKG